MASIADTEDFQTLNQDLREKIRVAEIEMRQTVAKLFACFPPELRATCEGQVKEMPAEFIRAHLPVYRLIDQVYKITQCLAQGPDSVN